MRTYKAITRRLHSSNLRTQIPLKMSQFLHRHRTACHQLAEEHRDWVLPQWSNVFSNESWFGLQNDSRRKRVWKLNWDRTQFYQRTCPLSRWISDVLRRCNVWSPTSHIFIEQTVTNTENMMDAIMQSLSKAFGENFTFKMIMPFKERTGQQTHQTYIRFNMSGITLVEQYSIEKPLTLFDCSRSRRAGQYTCSFNW